MPGLSSRQSDLAARDFRRILLVKPSSLGDVIHGLPVLHGLRHRYPAARIDWLVASPFAPLIEHHPDISGVVLFDRSRYGRMWRSPAAFREFVEFVGSLRDREYDLVIDLQGLFRSGFLSWASGARCRIGFAEAREGARVFYTHLIPRQCGDAHAVDRNYAVAAMLGFADVPVRFDLALTPMVQREAAALLREAGVEGGTRLVCVVPGARWETKVWLPERFAATIDRLSGVPGVRCVLLGSAAEADLCARIAGLCRARPASLAGRTTLPQMAAIIGRAELTVCHDSAAVHLAVAMGRRALCITGPTNPRRTGPYGRPQDVVRLDLGCSPCYLRTLPECAYGHRCMKELTVDVVAGRALAALGEP